jgi:hypothetical protein
LHSQLPFLGSKDAALILAAIHFAEYNLTKLEKAGLVRKENDSYVVNRVLLDSRIKISHYLIPRYLFHSALALAILLVEVTILRPEIPYREYYFSILGTAIFLAIFCYETAKVWIKGTL